MPCYRNGFGSGPKLWLRLTSGSDQAVTFTVTPNHYSAERARTYHVKPHGSTTHLADPLADAHGWYDLSVTVSGDKSWARRYTGHLETGEASTTG
jgi:phospholipase C